MIHCQVLLPNFIIELLPKLYGTSAIQLIFVVFEICSIFEQPIKKQYSAWVFLFRSLCKVVVQTSWNNEKHVVCADCKF